MPLRMHKKDLHRLLEDYSVFVTRHGDVDIHTRLVGAVEHLANTVKELRRFQKQLDPEAVTLNVMEVLEVLRRCIVKGFDEDLKLHFFVGDFEESNAEVAKAGNPRIH